MFYTDFIGQADFMPAFINKKISLFTLTVGEAMVFLWVLVSWSLNVWFIFRAAAFSLIFNNQSD